MNKQDQAYEPEIVDDEAEETTAVAVRVPDDVNVQVSTAKQYPRKMSRFRKDAEELACLDPETAASCFYVIPRGGKQLQGPTVRLAEIIEHAYGNFRCETLPFEADDTTVKITAVAFDLERNVANKITVSRRITHKDGSRFNDDMVNVTGNAATSVAFRNAVFRTIPRPVWEPIYNKARAASVGKAENMKDLRDKAVKFFTAQGVKPAEIWTKLGIEGIEDIGEDELIVLRGMVTASREGEVTVREMFRPESERAPGKKSNLNEGLIDTPTARNIVLKALSLDPIIEPDLAAVTRLSVADVRAASASLVEDGKAVWRDVDAEAGIKGLALPDDNDGGELPL